jgi:hypothetical protein
MTKRCPGGDGRGLVVYVDNQLRHSKRFDAEGIARDYPHLVHPLPRRRSSGSSFSSQDSNGSYNHEDGQLRYWTSNMCSNSPHLFDFVVTVSQTTHYHKLGSNISPAWWRWNSSIRFLALPAHCASCPSIRTRFSWFPNSFRFRKPQICHG